MTKKIVYCTPFVLFSMLIVLFGGTNCNAGKTVTDQIPTVQIPTIQDKKSTDLIDESKYAEIKQQFDLETINNVTFGQFLGGLNPRYKVSSAIKKVESDKGLYALECRGNYHIVLVVETQEGYQLVQTKEELITMYAPVDSPEEALSIVHLEEGGMTKEAFKQKPEIFKVIEDLEHVTINDDGSYNVDLLYYDPCLSYHGETFLGKYHITKEGTVTKLSSSQL